MKLVLDVDDQISLVPLSLSHAEELFDLVESSRPSLRKWLPWVNMVTTLEDERQYINYYQSRYARTGALTTVILFEDQIAGVIGLNYIDQRRQQTAIGYWLGDGFRKQSIMRRSCQSMVNYCFLTLGLHKVKIFCATENFASQCIPMALGFTQEGRIRQGEWLNDQYWDLFVYSMLETQWLAQGSGA